MACRRILSGTLKVGTYPLEDPPVSLASSAANRLALEAKICSSINAMQLCISSPRIPSSLQSNPPTAPTCLLLLLLGRSTGHFHSQWQAQGLHGQLCSARCRIAAAAAAASPDRPSSSATNSPKSATPHARQRQKPEPRPKPSPTRARTSPRRSPRPSSATTPTATRTRSVDCL